MGISSSVALATLVRRRRARLVRVPEFVGRGFMVLK